MRPLAAMKKGLRHRDLPLAAMPKATQAAAATRRRRAVVAQQNLRGRLLGGRAEQRPTMTASVRPIDTAAVADRELPVATRHRCRSVREEGKASNAKRQSTDHAVGGDRGLIVLA